MFNFNELREAMASNGITTDAQLIPDGKRYRFHIHGDSKRSVNGWYIVHDGQFPRAFYGSWKLYPYETLKWSAKPENQMTQEERKQYMSQLEIIKEDHIKIKTAAQAKAKENAKYIWNKAKLATNDHPYLVKKQINAHKAKIAQDGRLVIPIYDITGTLNSIQFISGNGDKMFLADGMIKGCYSSVGKLTDTIYICEGFATACSIQEVTGCGVIIAFNCGNLSLAAQTIKKKYPNKNIIIAADNDKNNPNNPGLTKAIEAARNISAKLAYPSFEGLDDSQNPTDFNDLMSLAGRYETYKQLTEITTQKQQDSSSSVSTPNQLCDISYRRMSDIEAKPINWLWKDRIAYGKVSIIAGNPGLGKSQITANIAATLSNGGTWPAETTPCSIGSVLILSAEDDPSDTIRPRLEAANADLKKNFVIDAVNTTTNNNKINQRSFNLKHDLKHLEHLIYTIQDVKLIIIDPITAYLGDTDSHKNADIRALLTPLAELASKFEIAVLCVSHLNKSGNTDALMRVMGSLAFVAAARAAFIVLQDPENEARRLFLPIKNNIGIDKTGFAFKIESCKLNNDITTSKIIWENDIITATANDIIGFQQNTEEQTALKEAEDFLLDLLAISQMPVKQIQKEAKDAGHAWATIKRARKKLGIQSKKIGMEKGWAWRLPPKKIKIPEDTHTKNVSTFAQNEYLRDQLQHMVTCHNCTHFQRDTIGNGMGIGTCKVKTSWQDPPNNLPLYPHIQRTCNYFNPLQNTENKQE